MKVIGGAVNTWKHSACRLATRFTMIVGLTMTMSIAQAQPPTKLQHVPAYDVSTIKPNKSGVGSSDIWEQDYVFRANNVSLKVLVQNAFEIQPYQIEGLPDWCKGMRFDITAKVVSPDIAVMKDLSNEEHRAMLRALYADRFHLKWHYESKLLPTYELVIGKAGVKFAEAQADEPSGISVSDTSLRAMRVPISRIADVLGQHMQRPVLDKTGLDGNYDLKLNWTENPALANEHDDDPDAPPGLTVALQEQLGLRLRKGRDPVKILVIDEVIMPTEN